MKHFSSRENCYEDSDSYSSVESINLIPAARMVKAKLLPWNANLTKYLIIFFMFGISFFAFLQNPNVTEAPHIDHVNVVSDPYDGNAKQCQQWTKKAALPPHSVHEGVIANASIAAMNYLNEVGINYMVEGGTLLGSYRHHGLITGDKDIDILIPVWSNKHILDESVICTELENNILPKITTYEEIDTMSICGLNGQDYADYFYQHMLTVAETINEKKKESVDMMIDNLNEKYRNAKDRKADTPRAINTGRFLIRVQRKERNYANHIWVKMYTLNIVRGEMPRVGMNYKYESKYSFAIDVKVELNDPWMYDICKCPWYETFTLCSTYFMDHLHSLFGDDYLTPDRDLNDKTMFERHENGTLRKDAARVVHDKDHHTKFTFNDFDYSKLKNN